MSLDHLIPLSLEKIRRYRIGGEAVDRLYAEGLAAILEQIQLGTGAFLYRLAAYIGQPSSKKKGL